MELSNLKDLILEKMEETNLPGVSVSVVKDGDVLFSRGFGFRNIEDSLPANERTIYAIGSITKSFTALAIMQLQEREKLDIEDPVRDYLPLDLRPKGEYIKIKHFLNHSSGIPALGYSESFIRKKLGAGKDWTPICDYRDMLDFVNGAGEWSFSKPGERWFYLNEGYALLGAIVEECSGLSYEEYLKENVFSPLGMDRTFFGSQKLEKVPNVAVPYILSKDGEQIPSSYPTRWISAHGGLRSSVMDLSKYVRMYLSHGVVGSTRVISKNSLKQMKSAGVPLPGTEQPFGEESYGLGLMITEDFFGKKLVGHGGSVLVSTGYIGFVLEEGIGISLLANGKGYPLANLGMYGLALMLGNDPEEVPFLFRERVLQKLEGVYQTYRGTMTAQVKKVGGLLELKTEDKYTKNITRLIPDKIESDRCSFFYLEGSGKYPVTFRLGEGPIDLLFERYRLRKHSDLLID